MHENILPGILSDETKPFFVVEPFDFAAGHIFLLMVLECADPKKRKDTGCSFSLCPAYRYVEPAYDSIDCAKNKSLCGSGQAFVLQKLSKVIPKLSHCYSQLHTS